MTFEGNHIRMGTQQSTTDTQQQPPKIKYAVTGIKRSSPRNKDREKEKHSKKKLKMSSKQSSNQEEKGLLLSRVSENCIVISVPNQSLTTSATQDKSDTISKGETSSTEMTNSKSKKKQKKKKHRHKSPRKDLGDGSVSELELAFSRVQKLHKKRNRAWKKEVKKSKSPPSDHGMHGEVLEGEVNGSKQMKISSNLFKIKKHLNKNNNSCSSGGSGAETVEMFNTPIKSTLGDCNQGSSTDLPSLVSPSCYVSLKKMNVQVRYPVDNSSGFPYSREMTLPANTCDNRKESSTDDETIDVVHVDASSLNATASLMSTASPYAVQGHPQRMLKSDGTFCVPQSMTKLSGLRFESKTHSGIQSTHSFLGRLLTSPSTPQHVKEQREHPRRKRAKPDNVDPKKVRKSKRQKRKRRREERKAQCNPACSKP